MFYRKLNPLICITTPINTSLDWSLLLSSFMANKMSLSWIPSVVMHCTYSCTFGSNLAYMPVNSEDHHYLVHWTLYLFTEVLDISWLDIVPPYYSPCRAMVRLSLLPTRTGTIQCEIVMILLSSSRPSQSWIAPPPVSFGFLAGYWQTVSVSGLFGSPVGDSRPMQCSLVIYPLHWYNIFTFTKLSLY